MITVILQPQTSKEPTALGALELPALAAAELVLRCRAALLQEGPGAAVLQRELGNTVAVEQFVLDARGELSALQREAINWKLAADLRASEASRAEHHRANAVSWRRANPNAPLPWSPPPSPAPGATAPPATGPIFTRPAGAATMGAMADRIADAAQL